METWFDTVVAFFVWLGDANVHAAEVLGFGPEWLFFAVVMLVIVLRLLRTWPTRQRRQAASPAQAAAAVPAWQPRRAVAAPDQLEGKRVPRNVPARAPRKPANDRARASTTATVVLAAIGLAIIAGASYFMLVAAQRAPEWRSSIWLFGSLMFLVGLGVLRAGVDGLLDRRVPGNSVESWLRDARWSREGTGPVASERIGSSALALTIFATYLAPFHLVLAAPLAHVAFWLTLGLLDLVFFVSVAFFIRNLRSRRLAGRAHLRWSSAPFRVGETLRARLETAKRIDLEVTVMLRCLRGGGSVLSLDAEPPADAKAVHVDERKLRMQRAAGGGSFIDLAIPLPEDAPPSLRSGAESVWWRLVVRAELAGPDFEVTFPLPVYGRSSAR